MREHPYFPGHVLKGGKLYVDGTRRFLKTGKPLRDFGNPEEVHQLIADLPVIIEKGYSNLALNCYWQHINPRGDGVIEISLEPLKKLIKAIRDRGIYVSLSVETYSVGGGLIPRGFWEKFPDAIALNHMGEEVRDTEYGYNTAVPSIFHKEYTATSRKLMSQLVKELGAENFLYFETTVEPQYMGTQWIDYSPCANSCYEEWCTNNKRVDAPPFPDSFPIAQDFLENPDWNCFRAQSLAEWVNGDARALREGADNKQVWIASDYLDAEEHREIRRKGNSLEFLRHLTETDIIQVNWTWCNIRRQPNSKAYERVHRVMKELNRDWVVTEHMTINGVDYPTNDVNGLLENTLQNSTGFGWEFVDIARDLDDPKLPPNLIKPGFFKPAHFSVYDANWNPKPPMELIENSWEYWMAKLNNLPPE